MDWKNNKFTIVIIILMLFMVSLEWVGIYDRIAESPTYGWIFNDMANPYMSSEQVAAFSPEDRYAWWSKVINNPEQKWIAEWYGAPYLDTIPKELRKKLDVIHDTQDKQVKMYSMDRGELRMKYAGSDQSGMVVRPDGKIISLTELNKEGMHIQEEFGCIRCHENDD
jgi:hypothetical protein